MTAREFYNKKAILEKYDNFHHWLDCSDLDEQADKIINWTNEHHQSRVNSISDDEIFFDAVINPKAPNKELFKAADEFQEKVKHNQ